MIPSRHLALLLIAGTWNIIHALDTSYLRCEYLVDPLGIGEPAPRLSWITESNQRGERQTAYEILVASSSAVLATDRGDLWASGKTASTANAHISYAGAALTSRQSCVWKVRVWDRNDQPGAWSKPAHFEMGLLKPTDWTAHWIQAPLIEVVTGKAGKPGPFPVPMLRATVNVATKPVIKARLYATALGLMEFHFNGKRVGDHMLAPEWTMFKDRSRYQVYDLTSYLRPGTNVLGTRIANGWYSGTIGNGGFQFWGTIPALLAQVEITYADGSVERVQSDGSWRYTASPITSTDFMRGENYDARQEVAGWSEPGLDDSAWKNATERNEAPRPLDPQVMEPVRQVAERAAKTVTEAKPGKWIFDLGQNMVGVVQLRLNEPAGTTVTIRHAEMLNTDGTMYVTNLRGAPSIDTYVCKGGGETWHPTFTFHGFRYVELSGLTTKPDLSTVTGLVWGSDISQVGEFSCSDARINQLQSNIWWGQRGNYLSVPTDCPQRDERLGWMGDAQVFVQTATGNADVAAFFSKWLVDVDDAQTKDGAFTDVSPRAGSGAGTPAWADAGVICPWIIYRTYNDVRLLERHYPNMVRWVEWCRTHSTNLIRSKDRGADYGDWLSQGANTSKELIGTAYFAYSTTLVAQSAAALGKTADAAKYQQLFTDIKIAFNNHYVKADGRIESDTQCAYLMALKFGLLDGDAKTKAVESLVADIAAKKNHLSTGFVGVSYLLPVLSANHQDGAAFKLLMQDSFPSWLFSVKHGATTIWERWDGWTPEKGFQNPGMNSFNHYSLGSCGEWMYGSLAGLDQAADSVGWQRLIIHPRIGGGLTNASYRLRTIRGTAASAWTIDGDTFTLTCTVPVGSTATVILPTTDAGRINENGKSIAGSADMQIKGAVDGKTALQVVSGSYQFTCPKP